MHSLICDQSCSTQEGVIIQNWGVCGGLGFRGLNYTLSMQRLRADVVNHPGPKP